MTKKKTDLLQHEAFDRAALLLDMVHNFLQEHPYIVNDKKLYKKVAKSTHYLYEVYQEIGNRI
jgi:hypothetical protein